MEAIGELVSEAATKHIPGERYAEAARLQVSRHNCDQQNELSGGEEMIIR